MGALFLDISKGEFLTAEGTTEQVEKILTSLNPKELLVERARQNWFREMYGQRFYLSAIEDWAFNEETAREKLLRQFGTLSLKGFGVEHMTMGIVAAGAILHYLDITRHDQLSHITRMVRINQDDFVMLDKFTLRNLEVLHAPAEGGTPLISILDQTLSPMGARLMRRWLAMPLKDPVAIQGRLDVVDTFLSLPELQDQCTEQIRKVGDLERLISKAAAARISPREMYHLSSALEAMEPLRQLCLQSGNPVLAEMGADIDPCQELAVRIRTTLNEDAPQAIGKGYVIAPGVHEELDELRHISHSGKDFLQELQQRESERTGITSLKVSFNNVFGYYIEVRNTHKDKVPPEWIRKQTLVSAERYITPELKDYESRILGAEERILALETQLYNQLVVEAARHIPAIQKDAVTTARLDCLLSFATVSARRKYVRPVIDDADRMDIRQGRHPVIEATLPPDQPYIANDVFLDSNTQQVIMLTGPNMSGKSALLRQTALITLMAQAGCFVPADRAELGVVDRIFTRVGASDNISTGESTFMVEMTESAGILNNLTPRSLILLDEIGRGTSTYDGISIAWAMAEYIHEHPGHPKTLFATHYHELNEMERSFSRIHNFNVSVKELSDKVIFLRKLVRGGIEHSFGIHVARMAGMPRSVVARAGEILSQLEEARQRPSSFPESGPLSEPGSLSEAGVPPKDLSTSRAGVSSNAGSPSKEGVPSNAGATSQSGPPSSLAGHQVRPRETFSVSKPLQELAERREGYQLSFYQLDDPVLRQIRDEVKKLDINNLTPLQALQKLNDIKKMVGL